MLNKAILIGRLTRTPELKHTRTSTAVTSFSLAVERDFRDKNTGERSTDFIEIVAWRSTAEFIVRNFAKGQLMAVAGRLQVREWTDDEGRRHRITEVIADNVYFCGGSKPETGERSEAPQFGEYPSGFADLDEDDGELPF